MGGSEISRSEEKSFENNDVFVWISKKIQDPLKVKLNIHLNNPKKLSQMFQNFQINCCGCRLSSKN